MLFDLISDVHIEMNQLYKETRAWQEGEPYYFAWHKSKKSDVLVIAGDLSNDDLFTRDIIREAGEHYEHLIWCDGNHDHYKGYRDHTMCSYQQNMERYRQHCMKYVPNATFLDGETSINIDGTLFVGANGWYDFRATDGMHPREQRKIWQRNSNDPVCIRFGKKNRPEKLADLQADQIAKMVEAAQEDDQVKEIVVVTHTIPTKDALIRDPTHQWFALNGAYCNMHMTKVRNADLSQKKIRTWCFGHTHWVYDFFKDGIHYITNPRGYRGELRWAKNSPTGVIYTGIKQVDTEEPDVKSAFGEIEE